MVPITCALNHERISWVSIEIYYHDNFVFGHIFMFLGSVLTVRGDLQGTLKLCSSLRRLLLFPLASVVFSIIATAAGMLSPAVMVPRNMRDRTQCRRMPWS